MLKEGILNSINFWFSFYNILIDDKEEDWKLKVNFYFFIFWFEKYKVFITHSVAMSAYHIFFSDQFQSYIKQFFLFQYCETLIYEVSGLAGML